ncbi:hypothetical protein LTR56_001019 [Elasticomyces elasticus]|nr:hypothetical protein LTR22_013235 [Elasticomyces elasticus]KAK3660093.1 hypothetical protein LTR56_001019 [Elasticomyces elasticus]KAK4906975.1 hypothetical protein LTR49_023948 [Elasticomyces elasticus]KAK5747069.1 hypothetical protein LTS12_022489 [Elasticomyces elasticus]
MANRANIVEFTRPKNNKGEDDGRLCIGHRKKDWAKAYYSPASTRDDLFADEEDDNLYNHSNPPTLAIFSESGGKLKACEPLEGEIAWYPHYDYLNCETGDKKEKKHLQKEFLFDCWKYCAVTDPARLATMEARFAHKNFTEWPRWRSWYDMAVRWKQPRQARRAARRRGGGGSGGGGGGTLPGGGPRRPGPHPDGGPNSDLDLDDEGYDDDGEEGLGRQEGPGRHEGSGRPGSMGPPSWKRKGSGAGTNGQKVKRPKPGTNGSGSASHESSRQSSALFMSGGLGSPPMNRPRSAFSPSVDGDDLGNNDSDQESHDWDDDHPEPGPAPRPGPRPRVPNGLGGAATMESPGPLFGARRHDGARTPTPRARSPTSPDAPARHREPSRTPNGTFRPSGDCTNAWRGKGLHGRGRSSARPNDEPGEDDDNIIVNGGRGATAQRESAARASRAASVVDEFNGPGVDDEEAVERLIRLTAPPDDVNDQNRPPSGEQGSPNDVHQSIEDGEDEDDP